MLTNETRGPHKFMQPLPRSDARWHSFHHGLVNEAADWAAARQANQTLHCGNRTSRTPRSCFGRVPTRGLVLLGDSIYERLRGTGMFDLHGRDPRLYSTFEFRKWWCTHGRCGRLFGAPLLLGVSGDQAQHVLWRAQHGEINECTGIRGKDHPFTR